MLVCKIAIYQKPVQQDSDEMWEIVRKDVSEIDVCIHE